MPKKHLNLPMPANTLESGLNLGVTIYLHAATKKVESSPQVSNLSRFGVDPVFSWFFPDVCHDVFPPLLQISFSVLEHTPLA